MDDKCLMSNVLFQVHQNTLSNWKHKKNTKQKKLNYGECHFLTGNSKTAKLKITDNL